MYIYWCAIKVKLIGNIKRRIYICINAMVLAVGGFDGALFRQSYRQHFDQFISSAGWDFQVN